MRLATAWTEERTRAVLTAAGVLLLVSFCLAPFGFMVLTSFAGAADYLAPGVAFDPTLENYRRILTAGDLHFLDYLWNSVLVSAVAAIAAVGLAAPAAYAATRLELPGKLLIVFAVLAMSMFPQVSLVSYLYRLMAGLGWINTHQALIFPYVAWVLPLALWILLSYFSQVPRDLDRAALVDGCSRWQAFRRVVLPIAAPGLASTLLLAFLFAFNEFLFALMLTADERAQTVPVGIALFEGIHGEIPWGLITAAATLTTLPVIALTLIFQKRIVRGLMAGAVKG